MRSIIEASGARLITMQVPASRDEGRYRQVVVNVQLTANIRRCARSCTRIETAHAAPVHR